MKKTKRTGRRIFLDYASATPLDQSVAAAMKPYFSADFQNPSSLYKEGVKARKAVESARERIARLIEARKEEIIFTSGGTESANMAILGVFAEAVLAKKSEPKNIHIITSAIEHPAVLETCRHIESLGGKVTYVAPRKDGCIHADDVVAALRDETVLVSIMHANNEIGTVNHLKNISRGIIAWKKSQNRDLLAAPFFHTDASQSANYLDIRKEVLGVDMMTLDGSKIYGPKGVGILFKKHSVAIAPILFGGSQENGLRPGTENVPLIVGFAAALEKAIKIRTAESKKVGDIRNYCLKLLLKEFPPEILTINGSIENRLPNNINFCIAGLYAEFAVIQLDAMGFAVSSVTACRNPDEETFSHVVDAIDPNCARSSIRVTFGRGSKKDDAKAFVKAVSEIARKNREVLL